jgi:hypothetical protein
MGAVAASVQAKITLGALDRARRDGGTVVRVQDPGVGYLCATKGTAEAVGVAEAQVTGLLGEQLLPLPDCHGLDARLPPIAVGKQAADQGPAKATRR